MKTTLRKGVIEVRLLKPEAAAVQKALDLVLLLAKMQPIDEALADHAEHAATGLRGVLDLAGEKEKAGE